MKPSLRCPTCHRENESDYSFCIFCGSPLHSGQAQQVSDGEQARSASAGLKGTRRGKSLVNRRRVFHVYKKSVTRTGTTEMVRTIHETIIIEIRRRRKR